MTTKEIIAYVIGAGGIGGLIAWARGRKKDKADVKKTIAEAEKIDVDKEVGLADGAFKLVDRLSAYADKLYVQHNELADDYDVARKEIKKLIENNEQDLMVLSKTEVVLEETKRILKKEELNHLTEVAELTNKIVELTGLNKESEKLKKESEALLAIKHQHCIESQQKIKVLQGERDELRLLLKK